MKDAIALENRSAVFPIKLFDLTDPLLRMLNTKAADSVDFFPTSAVILATFSADAVQPSTLISSKSISEAAKCGKLCLRLLAPTSVTFFSVASDVLFYLSALTR